MIRLSALVRHRVRKKSKDWSKQAQNVHGGGERSVHLAKAEGRAGADKELVIIEEIAISKWGTLMFTSGQQEPCLEARFHHLDLQAVARPVHWNAFI